MPALLNVEEQKNEKPILCIVGESSELTEKLLQDNYSKFRIIFVSSKKLELKADISDIYSLTYEEAQVLPKLEEKIDYAIVLITHADKKRFLPPIIEKLVADKAKTVFTIGFAEFKSNYDLILTYKDKDIFYFALLGEVLSQERGGGRSELSKIITSGLSKEEISIEGNELLPIYPVFLNDALTYLYRLLFGSFKNSNLYFIFYKSPETILSAIHILGRVNPEINIAFSGKESLGAAVLTRQELEKLIRTNLRMKDVYLDLSSDKFEKGIFKMLTQKGAGREEKIIVPGVKNAIKSEVSAVNKKTGHLAFLIKSFAGGVILFIFLNFCLGLLGILVLRSAINNIKNDNFKNVYQQGRFANTLILTVKAPSYLFLDLVSVFDTQRKLYETFSLIENASNLTKIAGKTMNDTLTSPFSSQEKLQTLLSNFTYLYLEGESVSLKQANNAIANVLKPEYSKILSFANVLPSILGFDGVKYYLILFQNNNELRPTGGFIGSVGELTIEKGLLKKLSVRDVYELDGQLKTHVEPPFVVRRYLQPHLYLRDSNFLLDFQETASKSALIYNLETGKEPDGIIAVNFDILKKIIKTLGPIELPEYKITVDDKNIGNFLQDTIQTNNFPGSTQKKDLLSKVLNQIILKATSNPYKSFEIAKLFPGFLEQKNVIISFENPYIQKLFTANGYGGVIQDGRVKKDRTAYDYLYVNEANIGVNKANEKISREITYETAMEQNTLQSSLKISLTNGGEKDDYKAYLQIVVPRGSKIEKIKIDNKEQLIVPAVTDPKIYEAKNFKAPTSLEVEQYNTTTNTIFAFIAAVQIKSTSVIDIAYDNGAKIPLSTISSYSLKYIKQPGTSPYKVTSTLYYPENYSPINTSADSYGKNYLAQEKTIVNDFEMNIELRKKSIQK